MLCHLRQRDVLAHVVEVILFLDVDGVLNPSDGSHPHIFAPECVGQLRRILDRCPQVQIVFSTSWRSGMAFFRLGWLWRQHELPQQRVIGRTPEFDAQTRGVEIKQWLDDATRYWTTDRIRRYAVLDDETEPILHHIPEHSVFHCDHQHGLTEEIAERVSRHFSAE